MFPIQKCLICKLFSNNNNNWLGCFFLGEREIIMPLVPENGMLKRRHTHTHTLAAPPLLQSRRQKEIFFFFFFLIIIWFKPTPLLLLPSILHVSSPLPFFSVLCFRPFRPSAMLHLSMFLFCTNVIFGHLF